MPLGVFVNVISVVLGALTGSLISDHLPDSLKKTMTTVFGFCAMGMGISSIMLMENMPAVILAVIPAAVPEVLALDSQLLEGRMVISIAAGYDFARLHPLLPEIAHHISTIPNTPIAVGRGVLICEDRHSLTDAQLARLHALFAPVSLMESVPARLFSAAGTLSGCTPAFTAMYLEALADAGVKYGLDRAAACRIAAQVLVGTGTLHLRTGAHPGAIKDGVCSPGGTTIRGVSALEKAAFRGAVIGALDAIEGGKDA